MVLSPLLAFFFLMGLERLCSTFDSNFWSNAFAYRRDVNNRRYSSCFLGLFSGGKILSKWPLRLFSVIAFSTIALSSEGNPTQVRLARFRTLRECSLTCFGLLPSELRFLPPVVKDANEDVEEASDDATSLRKFDTFALTGCGIPTRCNVSHTRIVLTFLSRGDAVIREGEIFTSTSHTRSLRSRIRSNPNNSKQLSGFETCALIDVLISSSAAIKVLTITDFISSWTLLVLSSP
mmetsp:Transcript_10409/g.19413  ORF Transcript_10409/g.19413 Transcript_10409/m.19413 type:complete len:235 (+) Transcript_10409:1247-1951(+)